MKSKKKIISAIVIVLALTGTALLYGYPPAIDNINSLMRQLNIPLHIRPSSLFIDQNSATNNGRGILPDISYYISKNASPEITVNSGDKYVKNTDIQNVCNLIQNYSVPTLEKYAGITPKGKVSIVLFSSEATYSSALSQANIDSTALNSILAVTSGLTVGDKIWIPLYRLSDDIDLTNDLSHELFHAFSNIEGYGDNLPVWVSEGMSWRLALLSQDMISSDRTDYTMEYYAKDVNQAAKAGRLIPLTATDNELLSAGYNVQYQYFLAVNELIHNYGQDAFLTFMHNVNKNNMNQQFELYFKEPFQSFQDRFMKSLETFTY